MRFGIKRIMPVAFAIIFITVASVFALATAPTVNRDRSPRQSAGQDAITGNWKALFEVEGNKVQGTFDLKLDGDHVTGTMYSAHTGQGTLKNGRWTDGELKCTADFEAHESIEITGRLKDGKLSGEFATEGRTGTWQATR